MREVTKESSIAEKLQESQSSGTKMLFPECGTLKHLTGKKIPLRGTEVAPIEDTSAV